ATPLYHLFDQVALLGIETAQLVLDVDAGLTAEVEQIFTLDVQLARQRIDADFLSLQAQLLVTTLRFARLRSSQLPGTSASTILPFSTALKRVSRQCFGR